MRNTIHIRFQPVSKEQQEILLAQLVEIGYEGFEEGTDYLSAYIPEEQYDEEMVCNLTSGDARIAFAKETIAPRNWNAEWEQNFQPVIIDDFCAVRAHFHAPAAGVKYEVIITPKMSFGTGHHATTFLMIQAMEKQAFQGKKVLDFGTGTGILAILANKLGASDILAIDNDDWSIANAAENVELNHCTSIVLKQLDRLDMQKQFDVILANINKHILLTNMAAIKQHLAPGGVVFMSGLLTGDRKDIEKAAQDNGLTVFEQKEKDNWICLTLKNF